MTSQHSNDRSRGTFIRWSAPARRSGQRPVSDADFVVDRRRLYKYLDSLESLSGE
ncbi:MAG TPA: hypothetical protein VLS96_15780 [Nodosilinea sp.]|nr:hypothetical protein [Nodosilinea sp.]